MSTSTLNNRNRARSLAVIAMASALVFTTACGAEGDRPGWKFLPGMMESVPHDTFEANPVSENGGMLLPPEGTIPVSGVPFPYGNTEEDAIRAGLELTNPMQPTPENVARGQHRYEAACLVCHGVGGEGDGPIIGRFPNPASLIADHAKSYPDGRIYHVITHGQGIMPAHALQVLPEERWAVVLYLRQLQGLLESGATEAASGEPEPAPLAEDTAADAIGGGQ